MQGRYRGFDDGRGYTPNPNPNSSCRKFNNRTSTAYNRSGNFNRRPCLPPPPPSKHEILMRAGKLAAEYLVSQGLLDPEKLPHNRGKSGKLKDFEGLRYGKENDDSWNEDYYGPSEYYRERESGFDQLPGRSGNTMESRSENQDLAEDGGSKTSSLSLKKDVLDDMVGDNPVADSGVSMEVQSDADYDSKKETTTEDNNNNNNNSDGDDVMKAIALENVNIELKEENKEIDGEEKGINKRKREVELKEEKEIDGEEESTNKREREDDELPVRNVRLKDCSQDEEIEAPLEIMEEKIEDEIDAKIEGEEDDKIEGAEDGKIEEGEDCKIEGGEDGKIEEVDSKIEGGEDGKSEEEEVVEEEDGKIEEEKQVSSEPLEVCDLNLVHGNEVTENDHENELSVNIQLDAINNNGNDSGEFDKILNDDDDDKEVQVCDIEVDVAVDGSAIDPSNPGDADTIREEPIYPNLDSFLNHEHADLNCIHDGYSLDFPNFLGSDITGCSSIPTHLNNLGSEMEGLPNDDDSMYVSLAEMPLGFMEVWDTPGQDYGKFF